MLQCRTTGAVEGFDIRFAATRWGWFRLSTSSGSVLCMDAFTLNDLEEEITVGGTVGRSNVTLITYGVTVGWIWCTSGVGCITFLTSHFRTGTLFMVLDGGLLRCSYL